MVSAGDYGGRQIRWVPYQSPLTTVAASCPRGKHYFGCYFLHKPEIWHPYAHNFTNARVFRCHVLAVFHGSYTSPHLTTSNYISVAMGLEELTGCWEKPEGAVKFVSSSGICWEKGKMCNKFCSKQLNKNSCKRAGGAFSRRCGNCCTFWESFFLLLWFPHWWKT